MSKQYEPYRLGWCKSYEEEVSTFRELISGNPIDVDLLKDEYFELTGENYDWLSWLWSVMGRGGLMERLIKNFVLLVFLLLASNYIGG